MAGLKRGLYFPDGDTWNALDCSYPKVYLARPEITLKGLEYLAENSLMKKAAQTAAGIVTDVITKKL